MRELDSARDLVADGHIKDHHRGHILEGLASVASTSAPHSSGDPEQRLRA
jgi:hypothetical protein